MKKSVRKKTKKTVRQKHPASWMPRADRSVHAHIIPVQADFLDLPAQRVSHLTVMCPGKKTERLSLGTGDLMTLGRDAACNIHLPLANVSRQHARVTSKGGECSVEDLASTNGTFVNNVRVSRCVLRNDDSIRIGEASIVFCQRKIGDKS